MGSCSIEARLTNTLATSKVDQLQLGHERILGDAWPRGGTWGKGRGEAGRGGGASKELVGGVAGGGVGTATAWTPPLLLGGVLHVLLGTL